ncbi:MAG: hypothetical protein F4233_03430 [Rhodospirillaceae bacterium]|nr:hypothetical protein [Rhodospirillaceae bacterium]
MSTFSDELSQRPDWHATSRTGLDDRVPDLKRTADGAIDYDFYLRRAHRIRAEAARGFLRRAGSALRSAFGRAGNRWAPGFRLLSSH